MKAVIFAGGVGTRLWPLSRKKSPKQFEKIIGDQSTLQHAAERLIPGFSWKDIYASTGKQFLIQVISSVNQRFVMSDRLSDLSRRFFQKYRLMSLWRYSGAIIW